MRLQRVGRTMGCDSLPDENRDHKKRSEQQAHADTDSARKPIFPRGSPADIQLRLVAGFARKRARHTTNLTYRTSIRCRSVAIFERLVVRTRRNIRLPSLGAKQA